MNVVAYCRVSTDKSDQLNSLDTQKEFFESYCMRNHFTLVHTYADEGISGTKTKNRTEFLRMMHDAEKGMFEQVIVKDVSRLARNTVDLLQSVRKLKALNIETVFITSDMKTIGNSEFVLTLMGAMAQEESSNTSKRVKFGKRENARKGRVPNIVFGYNKIPGEYFDLKINEVEAQIVRQIYEWYTNEGYGASKIASMLNEKGIKTKRHCKWTQNTVSRILKNEIYIGKIINGREEVSDFLTGVRREIDQTEWMICLRPDLAIIEEYIYKEAQRILQCRNESFHLSKERQSNKFTFSTLIRCAECGYSFRRMERTYKNTYVSWVCSGRNTKGTGSCDNKIKIPEEKILETIRQYIMGILLHKDKDKVIQQIIAEFNQAYKEKNEDVAYEKQLTHTMNKLKKSKEKYQQMFLDDIIDREELKQNLENIKEQLMEVELELKKSNYNLRKGDQLETLIYDKFNGMEELFAQADFNNTQLKNVVQKILVHKDGTIDIYLRLFSEIGITENSLHMQATIHKDVTERLTQINPTLAEKARVVLDLNKSERHIRGGLATKEKYLHKVESK